MGILSLAVGLGAGGGFGAMLHAVNHSLTKGMLFLVAGNILALYRSKSTREVRGVLRSLPVSGVLWVAGFLAITGSPPFGPFLSELVILKAALDQGQIVVAALYLLALSAVFVGMATVVLRMAQGEPAGLPAEYVAAAGGAIGVGHLVFFLGELPLAVMSTAGPRGRRFNAGSVHPAAASARFWSRLPRLSARVIVRCRRAVTGLITPQPEGWLLPNH